MNTSLESDCMGNRERSRNYIQMDVHFYCFASKNMGCGGVTKLVTRITLLVLINKRNK